MNGITQLPKPEISRPKTEIRPLEPLAATLAADWELAFTQEDLARFFGKDQSTISRWIRKHREVS